MRPSTSVPVSSPAHPSNSQYEVLTSLLACFGGLAAGGRSPLNNTENHTTTRYYYDYYYQYYAYYYYYYYYYYCYYYCYYYYYYY